VWDCESGNEIILFINIIVIHMRKRIFLLPIIFVAVFMTNCKKDISNDKKNAIQLSADDLKYCRMMESFNARLKSDFKNGETMTTDDAVWYLEGSLNYDYSRPDTTIDKTSIDSVEVIIPKSETGQVELSEIASAKEEFITKLQEQYQSLSGDKKVMVIDIVPKSDNADELTLKMYSTMGVDNHLLNPTFGPNDNWTWGFDQGKCGDISYAPLDASDKIQQYANYLIGVPAGQYTVGEVETVYRHPWDPDVRTTSNPFGYDNSLLFFASGPYPDPYLGFPCLHQAEMNYYLNGIKTLAQILKPAGKGIISYKCEWNIMVGMTTWGRFHDASITYGIYHSVIGPPNPL
jgi:hypothetical protein